MLLHSRRHLRNPYFNLTLTIILILNTVLYSFQPEPVRAAPLSPSQIQTQAAPPPIPETRTVPPVEDPHLPSLSLNTTSDTNEIEAGGEFTLTINLQNFAPDPATNVQVTMPLPTGAEALAGDTAYSGTAWNWNLSSLAAGSETNFSVRMKVPTLLPRWPEE